jgi:hypothetical protein
MSLNPGGPRINTGEDVTKLFRVEVIRVLYVLAEDYADARHSGQYWSADEDPISVSAVEVSSFKEVDPEWKEARPYGGDGKKTVRQILEEPELEEGPKPYVDPPEQQKFNFEGPSC